MKIRRADIACPEEKWAGTAYHEKQRPDISFREKKSRDIAYR